MNQAIITIDGPAASGKSALCQHLASGLKNWDWLSTGIFYRGLAYMIEQNSLEKHPSTSWIPLLKNQDWQVQLGEKTRFKYQNQDVTSKIYNEKMDRMASKIAAYPEIRQALISYQRKQKQPQKGLIAEGRDCGTAIFPKALLKIYLTAPETIRAQRRAQERNQKEDLTTTIQTRDQMDSQRSCNPLAKPLGAWEIQTDAHSLDEIEKMVHHKARSIFSQFI